MKRLLGPRLPIEFAERADADMATQSCQRSTHAEQRLWCVAAGSGVAAASFAIISASPEYVDHAFLKLDSHIYISYKF